MSQNAFIIIDMQKDFNVPGAPFRVDCGLEALPYIEQALEATRKSNLPIVHVFRYYRANGVDCEITRYDAYKSKGFHGCTVAEEGAEILDSIKPIAGEYTIVKQRWSAFFQTELDMILRRLGVKQVILAGVQTPNCIRGTVWDANSLDYEVIVLTDATNAKTPEVHQANLFDMKNIGIKMMTTAEYVECLKNNPDGPEAGNQLRIRNEIAEAKNQPEPHDMYDYSAKRWR
ncbi:MAG: cysteine hydrolase [Erysipelotrichaceae bacterium]|nr:cysteine hydrolase [Erysipelotrichaceae bacterium]MBQ9987353.1 cysteine hydrolase [Erysipelotrichales bacterium]MBR3693386.1 cysteine hydrolase [Erysipelotrichales bacterium]